ncbi:hypothetical protein A1O7_08352 [Cladophialophora yegresii CBS 114405]|uniref:Uncharacterized protein n=1 Tax=Cladophialophora yegresii CBS 114405 TaxID=1182544 RepID=W9VQZ1_9EURO|nr:uncharacterized protein A1O7_08352 [Cladophialophora yegresii CBS 114405]EXJ55425.1 hypothetical protein A1O7_08352 [Cladophialophora yegresii CBS 114405]
MAPKLERCMTVRGYIAVGDDILHIKNVLNGPQRSFIPVTGGYIRGVGPAEGLEAEISPASSDGVLMNPSTNTAHLNVRVGARSSTGAAIFVQYQGIIKVNEAGGKVLSGASDAKSTEYGEQEWFISPLIERSDERLKWMEESVWVGQGHWVVDEQGSAVEYQVYRLVN